MTQREIRWSFVNIRAVVKRARLWYRIAKAVNERAVCVGLAVSVGNHRYLPYKTV